MLATGNTTEVVQYELNLNPLEPENVVHNDMPALARYTVRKHEIRRGIVVSVREMATCHRTSMAVTTAGVKSYANSKLVVFHFVSIIVFVNTAYI